MSLLSELAVLLDDHFVPVIGGAETVRGTDGAWPVGALRTVFFGREVLTTRALISMAERLVQDVLMLMFACGLALLMAPA